jgi:hypothetical protein
MSSAVSIASRLRRRPRGRGIWCRLPETSASRTADPARRGAGQQTQPHRQRGPLSKKGACADLPDVTELVIRLSAERCTTRWPSDCARLNPDLSVESPPPLHREVSKSLRSTGSMYPGPEILMQVGRIAIAGARLDVEMGELWHHLDRAVA